MLVNLINIEDLKNLSLIEDTYNTYLGTLPWIVHLKGEVDREKMICCRSNLSHQHFFNTYEDRSINSSLRSFIFKEKVLLNENDIIQMYQFDKDKNIYNFKEYIYENDKAFDNFLREHFIACEKNDLIKLFKNKENFKLYFKNIIDYFVNMKQHREMLKHMLALYNIQYIYNEEEFGLHYDKFIDYLFSNNKEVEYKNDQEAGSFLFCFLFFGFQNIIGFEDKIYLNEGKLSIQNVEKIQKKLNN